MAALTGSTTRATNAQSESGRLAKPESCAGLQLYVAVSSFQLYPRPRPPYTASMVTPAVVVLPREKMRPAAVDWLPRALTQPVMVTLSEVRFSGGMVTEPPEL